MAIKPFVQKGRTYHGKPTKSTRNAFRSPAHAALFAQCSHSGGPNGAESHENQDCSCEGVGSAADSTAQSTTSQQHLDR